MEALPTIKPGHEKRLSELEVLQIGKHFVDSQNLELRNNAIKAAKEACGLKMQMCDLSKANLQAQMSEHSRAEVEIERARQNLSEVYEKTVRSAIKTKYNLPKDKGFSFDPETYEITVTE